MGLLVLLRNARCRKLRATGGTEELNTKAGMDGVVWCTVFCHMCVLFEKVVQVLSDFVWFVSMSIDDAGR